MNNPFCYTPTPECQEAFRRLLTSIERLEKSSREVDINFCSELEAGKMLGVLIAADPAGERHTLYAFSGQIGSGGFNHPGFVEAPFDYLQPDGYFKTKEADISRQNERIACIEATELADARRAFALATERADTEVERHKEAARLAKAARKARRDSGEADQAELDEMIRRSQFEKAELRRIKKRAEAELTPFRTRLNAALSTLAALKEQRRKDSEDLQNWLFSNFTLLNARGESKSLTEIFSTTAIRIPPSGAGECCAPKLLQAAYRRRWKPIAIAEYWYGQPKDGEVRIHGEHYPACRGKCLPVLSWMLQGINTEPPISADREEIPTPEPKIIYENEWFCVVNKPSGLLSVPGKGAAPSVQQWLTERYGAEKTVKVAHRLDQDTSGLLIATFSPAAYKTMQSLFATRKVKKTYIAVLDGDYQVLGLPRCGRIQLPLSPDLLDRPRQQVDLADGKEAITDYEFLSRTDRSSRVIFRPHTGRTHQLRVHAASPAGLSLPIAGDPLYGKKSAARYSAPRLLLHAQQIEFTFPLNSRHYRFTSPTPF